MTARHQSLTERGEAALQRRISPYRKFVSSLVPNWLLCRQEVSHGAKLTYARLCQFAGNNGHCFPSQQTIAREIGSAARSVRDYLTELETHGLIERERRGLRRTNVYHFLHHPWIDDDKGNTSGPKRQKLAGPARQNIATLDRQIPAVQERQNPAVRRESFEENPKKRIRKKERRATSSVDFGGTKRDFKFGTTEDTTSTDASAGGLRVAGEVSAVPDSSTGAAGPFGIPADYSSEELASVQEVTDFWQRKIREESFLVEFFHRCVRHMHPEITIRTRLEYDLANAQRLMDASRAVIKGANQPFAAIFQMIPWYVAHHIESEQDAAINRMTPFLWDWREAGTQEPTGKASRFLDAERQRLGPTIRQEKERQAAAEKAKSERQRIVNGSEVPKIGGDMQITGNKPGIAKSEPPKPWATPNEIWERYCALLRAQLPHWLPAFQPDREFREFCATLGKQSGDRWELLARYVQWHASESEAQHARPTRDGQYVETYFSRFLKRCELLENLSRHHRGTWTSPKEFEALVTRYAAAVDPPVSIRISTEESVLDWMLVLADAEDPEGLLLSFLADQWRGTTSYFLTSHDTNKLRKHLAGFPQQGQQAAELSSIIGR